MSRIRFLQIAVFALLLSNLLLIAYLILSPKNPLKGPEGPKNYIIQKLSFDAQQIKNYEQLIAAHRMAIRAENDSLLSLKTQLYHLLSEPNDTLKGTLIAELAQHHSRIDQIHFAHFKDIQSLCKPEQKALFEEVSKELAKLFLPGPPKPSER
jgi:hypothetical protein